jgi:signal transduction histidine kinase
LISDTEVSSEQLDFIRSYYKEKLSGSIIPIWFSAIRYFDFENDENIYLAVKVLMKEYGLTRERFLQALSTIQRNQIKKIADELKESNEARVNFFTGMSHEFKTPLTLILSSLESLKESIIQKGSKPSYEIELISKNSNRLLRLIDNLLDFRKIENKTFNLRVSKTNVYDFTFGIFRDFENEAKKRNIKFEIHASNKKIELYIDRNLMDKVYFNLLSNAFKFTPDNGKIEISIQEKGNQEIFYQRTEKAKKVL